MPRGQDFARSWETQLKSILDQNWEQTLLEQLPQTALPSSQQLQDAVMTMNFTGEESTSERSEILQGAQRSEGTELWIASGLGLILGPDYSGETQTAAISAC